MLLRAGGGATGEAAGAPVIKACRRTCGFCAQSRPFDRRSTGRRTRNLKATDRTRAFGAVLGKALEGLEHGRGLIPILVCLQ
jgi:hypothetical protein